MSHRRLRGLAALCVLAAAAALGGATPADAHGVNGQPLPDAAHYLTKITSVEPALRGVTVRTDPRGEWIEVTNTTTQALNVFGYFHEPYLRITGNGVAENLSAPSLQLNQSLFADLSQTSEGNSPPRWRTTSASHTARWHDHRIHWMGADQPPNVKAAPQRRHLIGKWQVHLALGTRPITVSGSLSWLPKSSAGLGLTQVVILALYAIALVSGAAAVAFLIVRRRRTRHSAPAPGPDRPGGVAGR